MTKKTKASRQEKKRENQEKELLGMIETLEREWKRPVKYSCVNCLRDAYDSVIAKRNGYVTDEELIESSNHTLRHK